MHHVHTLHVPKIYISNSEARPVHALAAQRADHNMCQPRYNEASTKAHAVCNIEAPTVSNEPTIVLPLHLEQ
jgi:hypothetical protein